MYSTSAAHILQGHFLRNMIIAVSAVATLLATAGTARGSCGSDRLSLVGHSLVGHALARAVSEAPVLPSETSQPDKAESNQEDKGESNPGIVGLWHAKYSDSKGNPYYEAFDMWHDDGTEWETAYSDPRAGNYCLGVWKKAGPRTVQLIHVGWNFNPDGSNAGYFTMTETNTVSREGDTYTGTFVYKLYEVNGNLTQEVTGTQVATRFKL